MAFDPTLPDSLVEVLGPAGALDALLDHRAQAETLLAQALVGPDAARAAHRLVGCAGQLGMSVTAAVAKALEIRLRRDGGLPSSDEAAHLQEAFGLEWAAFRAWAAQQER
jgi:hypothetical protein